MELKMVSKQAPPGRDKSGREERSGEDDELQRSR